MKKVSFSNKSLSVILITLLAMQFFPYQSLDAFVQNQLASTILGAPNVSTALSFGLFNVTDVEFDASGNLWVADTANNRVTKYSTTLSTGEAASIVLGQPNLSANDVNNGGITANSLRGPTDIKFDGSGNLWISDADNHRILRFDAPLTTGESATLVLGQADFVSGLANRGGSVAANTLNSPGGLHFDGSGNLWAADELNHRVLRYDFPFTNGEAAALVIGQTGFTSGSSNQGGSPSATTLSSPIGVTMDTLGNLWVSDSGNNRVLKYVGTTFSTGQSASVVLGQTGFSTTAPGTTTTTLSGPSGLEFLSDGHLFVSDYGNSRLVHYSDGDSLPSTSSFSDGAAGDIFIGQPDGVSGFCNQSSIPASPADNTLCLPEGLAVDASGNLWVADFFNNRVLKFTAPLSTDMSASIVIGQQNFVTSIVNRGGLSSTLLSHPDGIASGSFWVADIDNNRVVKFVPPYSTGMAATIVVGQPDFVSGLANLGSTPIGGSLDGPGGIFVDTSGNLWVTDIGNNRVLRFDFPIAAAADSADLVLGQSLFTTNTLASPTASSLVAPDDVTLDSSGNVWVADLGNNRVLKYAPPFSNGMAATLVLGQADFVSHFPNRGLAAPTSNTLDEPIEAAFDTEGNLWITDANNNRVLMFSDGDTSAATSIFVTGQAASFVIGQPDFISAVENNGGISTNTFIGPIDLAFGSLGIADDENHRVLLFEDQPSTTLLDYNLLGAGVNGIGLGSFSTSVTVSGSWDTANLNIQQTDANPVTASPGSSIGKFYEVVENSPDIGSSRTVSITYTDAEVAAFEESTLKIRRFDGSTWSDLTTSVNTATNTASASTSGYSIFVLVGTPPAPPSITSFAADDPNGGADTGFSAGDTLTIRFDTSTNRGSLVLPPGFPVPTDNKNQVDLIFTFSQSLGTDYIGRWLTESTYQITSVDPTGATVALGTTTATVLASENVKNAAETSAASTSTSPTLTGSFGTFTETDTNIAATGTATVTVPSGQTVTVTTPAGAATTDITVSSAVAAEPATFEFFGQVVDIESTGDQCNVAPGCTLTFTFDDADLTAAGISLAQVRILHDDNPEDGDFADAGESLVPSSIVPASPPGPYVATVTEQFTSKFAIGGVRALALGGASGDFSPPSFSSKAFAENEYPLTIDGTGFKLDKYSQTIPTISLETGEPIQMKMLLYDPSGPSSIHHLAMYMNLRGLERDISHSDTYIIYDKSVPAVISDPNGFFGKVTVSPQNVGNKLELTFDVTFAKPMEKSDIIFRMWDDKRNNADTKVFDAIQVTGPEVQSGESILTETTPVQTIEPKQTSIPTWIKDNAGWWKDGQIADSEFVSGIQYLIQNDVMTIPETEESSYLSPQPIPSWIKNNAGWWHDGLISDSEFVSAIQWLVSNGIMKVS